jgi:hypothetical protein
MVARGERRQPLTGSLRRFVSSQASRGRQLEKAKQVGRMVSHFKEQARKTTRSRRDSNGPQRLRGLGARMPQSREPRVGIFWLFQGNIIIDSTPLSRAERYGKCLTHARGHLKHWTDLQRTGAVPAEVEYEEPPRGRVIYDSIHEGFVLYADRCILGKNAVVKQLMTALVLPAERTTTSSDQHYRCAKCL